MNNSLPDASEIRKIVGYDPATGRLWWLPRTPDMFAAGYNTPEQNCAAWNTRRAHKDAFTTQCPRGVKYGQLMGKMVKAHRVAWAVAHGHWPELEVDHIDQDPSNNKLENLRLATRAQNGYNRAVRQDSGSGIKGVRWKPCKRKWQARIRKDGKEYHLGYFDSAHDAEKRHAAAVRELHGEFGKCAMFPEVVAEVDMMGQAVTIKLDPLAARKAVA